MYNMLQGLHVCVFTLDGDLYAGTSVDFMGNNAAIFRSSVHTTSQHYIRTEAYNDHWLNGEILMLVKHCCNVCKYIGWSDA